MLELSNKWAKALASQRETGMGYQVVTIRLKDGRQFDGVTVVGGIIPRIAGAETITFHEDDIADIVVTHDPIGASLG